VDVGVALFPVLVFGLVSLVVAQVDLGHNIRQVRVHLAFAGGVCDLSASVTLTGHNGPLAQASANEQCVVEFANVPEGTYHLYVSGQSVPYTDSGTITMDSGSPDEIEVQVDRANHSRTIHGSASSGLVSTADLGVPVRAQKEFDKANERIAKQDLKHAIQDLNNAIAIYPGYALAYNNLGVVYGRLGDHVREGDALQKAINLNDHFAIAYLNLGRMNVTSGDFPAAEKALNRAAELDPTEATTLVVLAYSEFMNGHFDDVIATARKAHQLPGAHAFAHRVAARAYLKKRDGESAISELQLFLKEDPTGDRADGARKELAEVQGIVRELAKRASK